MPHVRGTLARIPNVGNRMTKQSGTSIGREKQTKLKPLMTRVPPRRAVVRADNCLQGPIKSTGHGERWGWAPPDRVFPSHQVHVGLRFPTTTQSSSNRPTIRAAYATGIVNGP